ncbi:MAG TPA: hypothetical protein DCL61_16895 [Cyanobacteria bacterium UBA12227]|nr:hypothetical protein [Cyanobacteria bacterium UBA12227]HAX89249.1 hypothetical protein [Cyanobacteria bacterium UBA11370]HBY75508.1 hypothetical protein [Cyanobacteria bacterium UBA11148]
MMMAEVNQLIQYVTNSQGECIGVVIPLAVWEQLMPFLQALMNAEIDDQEPKENILADLQESIRQARRGETFPLSELWDGIDE